MEPQSRPCPPTARASREPTNMPVWPQIQLRSWNDVIAHLRIELQLVVKEWKVLLPCVLMQYVHGIFTNWAHYIQAHVLDVTQRFKLHDVGYAILPEISGTAASVSDILVFACIFAPALGLIASIPFVKPNPQRPRYLVIVGKRLLLHISICLVFRIISFLVTSLPGPADHCELKFNATCLEESPNDPIPCIVDNPDFNPPTIGEFFYNLNSLNKCGDLMFSSHTIYTLSFILGVWKYWPSKIGVSLMIATQIAIVFLIIASRKHYTLDVFTALYVVPLFWFTQDAYLHDINHKDVGVSIKTMRQYYDLDVSADVGGSELDSAEISTIEVQSASGLRDDIRPFHREASM